MTDAISIEGIAKLYRLGTIGGGTVIPDLRRWWRHARKRTRGEFDSVGAEVGEFHTFERDGASLAHDSFIWALRDVSLQIRQGEVLGIIGRNGAGKSTLLKILSRVTAPTRGVIKARGRISSLLEVGTGFHPELTGRENVFLNGAILGMSRAEVRRKFDEIVDFSGVEHFIDTPVKRYSSGMYVRLAFAVAAHLEPEILVVDEVLAVGDTAFQRKCLGKMEDVAHAGRTVLFVSHNVSAIADLCTMAVWLEKGQIVDTGGARSVVAAYLSRVVEPRRIRTWSDMRTSPGNQTVRLLHAEIESESGHDADYWTVETPLRMTFRFWNFRSDLPLHAEIKLFTKEGICAFQSASRKACHARGIVETKCRLPAKLLNDGSYSLTFSVHYAGTEGVAAEAVLAFDIGDVPRDIFPADKWPGVLRPELAWSIDELGSMAG